MKNYPDLYFRIWKAVKGVRKGRVATYGQIARLCDLRGHARLVGYALHNLPPNSDVPWHRIINAKGMVSLRRHTGAHESQRRLLEKEGIVFVNDKIDLAEYSAGGNSKGKKHSAHGAKRGTSRAKDRIPE
ncbi:MAG: MGMT family protein [Bacteroidetes bacterium]|jgi:methylated-DNA-protein-cysteine methyltransferase-like protein|nr:MGMT family protein [Bacteroidota bacterium]